MVVNLMKVKLMVIKEDVKQLKIKKIKSNRIIIEDRKSATYRRNDRRW